MQSSTRLRIGKLAASIVGILVVWLLFMPATGDWIAAQPYSSLPAKVARGIVERSGLLIALVLVGALVVRLALPRIGMPRLTVAVGPLALLALAGVAAANFHRNFPLQDVLDGERLATAGAVLLGRDTGIVGLDPQPVLVVKREPIVRASFPAIDFHFHLGSMPPSITPERLVEAMDATGIDKIVDLDGSPGRMEPTVRNFLQKYPDRFILFAKPDLSAISQPDGLEKQLAWLKMAAHLGARGIKVGKSFGLNVVDAEGKVVPIDDPRYDAIWGLAGELELPVLMHTADPPAFFQKIDRNNERYEELLKNPDWSYFEPRYPRFKELMAQRERLLARHPDTQFIGAHIGSNEDDLAYAAYLLDRYPNYSIDMSSRIGALGRQPYTTRRFFIQYQDRIVFGTDGGFALDTAQGWTPERYFRSYVEFLETTNENVVYPLWGINLQGRWRVHGIGLPPEVLDKLYRRNAERLVPSSESVRERVSRYFPVLSSGKPILD